MGSNKIKSIPISNNLMQIIEGELLGDGSIKPGVNQSCFSYHNSNFEYIQYLVNKFKAGGIPIIGKGINIEYRDDKTYYSFATVKTVEFHHIKNKWYGDKKIIPQDLLLTPTVLLHWWLGDGSIRNEVSGTLCTDCFNLDDLKIITTKLNSFLNIRARINPEKHKYYRVFIPCQHMKDFFKCIGKSPIKSMAYKWNIRPYCKTNYLNITKKEFFDLYITKNKSAKELANYYKCSYKSIYRKAKEFGIQKDIKKQPIKSIIWENKDDVCQMYNRGDSITIIAKKFKTSRATVRKLLKRFDIYKGRKI